MQLRNSVRRHSEVHLGPAPGALVSHEAAVQWVVDVRTCAPRSWRPCRAGTGRRRGALGRASGCRCAQCSTGSLPGSRCSRPRSLRPRCVWSGPRCSRCWGEPSSLTVRRPWGPGSALLWRPPPRRPRLKLLMRCLHINHEQLVPGRCFVPYRIAVKHKPQLAPGIELAMVKHDGGVLLFMSRWYENSHSRHSLQC